MQKALISFLVIVFFMTSCATIVNGPHQDVSVSSDPTGATVSDGKTTKETPASFVLDRNRDYLLIISKKGYETKKVKIVHVINGWVAGNLISFGLLGAGVDTATGAIFTLEPHKIVVTLKPVSKYDFFVIARRLDASTLQSKLDELDRLKQSNLLTNDQYEAIKEITIECVRNRGDSAQFLQSLLADRGEQQMASLLEQPVCGLFFALHEAM